MRNPEKPVITAPYAKAFSGTPTGSCKPNEFNLPTANDNSMNEPYDDSSFQDDDQGDELESWDEWPVCPNCNSLRQAICPICETSGTTFPLAEWIPTAPIIQLGGVDGEDEVIGAPLMLMCTTCDEAFAPNFYERCEHCGYDFESGVVIEIPEPEAINMRMLVVVAVLVVATVGLMAFFGFVLQ